MAAYTPAELATDLAGSLAVVLPYVGAGVGGALLLFFAFLGIRAGYRFFRSISGESRGVDMVSFYNSRGK